MFNEELSDDIFKTILACLKNNEFSGYISMLGYQEILCDIDTLRRKTTLIYNILGDDTHISISSNGDYLDKIDINNISVTKFAIMDYDNKGCEYWVDLLVSLGALNVTAYNTKSIITFNTPSIRYGVIQLNWLQNTFIEDRGGFLTFENLKNVKWLNNREKRTYPCPEPEYFINIYYDGSVTPCCHIRPDNPKHKEYILGNVNDTPLVDIYYSEKAENFRKKLREPNGDYPEPCKYCQKFRNEICVGSPSGWDYYPDEYKGV